MAVESVTFSKFDSGVLEGSSCKRERPATGYDFYAANVLPFYLRTEQYDKLLVSGVALCDGELQFEPDGTGAREYAMRWERFQQVRLRIENGELATRTIIGIGALRQVLGVNTDLSNRAECINTHQDALRSLRETIALGAHQIGLLDELADTRSVPTGYLELVSYRNAPTQLPVTLQSTQLVEAEDDRQLGGQIVERARRAFDGLWEQSKRIPEVSIPYLDRVIRDIGALAAS